jgi:hypothetical protein
VCVCVRAGVHKCSKGISRRHTVCLYLEFVLCV